MNTFIGVDLGWYGKPSGLASLALEGSELRHRNTARLEGVAEILGWIQTEAGCGSAVAAVDAPLIIRNQTSSKGVFVGRPRLALLAAPSHFQMFSAITAL